MQCPVCFDANAREFDSAGGVIETECNRCGKFRYTAQAWEKLRKASPEKRGLVASWLWEQSRFGSVPTIDHRNIDALLSLEPLRFLEKARRLLMHLAEQSSRLGTPLDFSSPALDALLGTLVHNDIVYINELLVERGWVTEVTGGQWRVTGAGFLQADEWTQTAVASSQAFIAMWIDKKTDAAGQVSAKPRSSGRSCASSQRRAQPFCCVRRPAVPPSA
jgi:hypothetical protein